MPKCVVMGAGGRVVEINPTLLSHLQEQAEKAYLEKRYHLTRDNCCVCGVHISTEYGEPLGRYFVMDKKGQFYCMNCEKHFGDGDEEIYVAEEDGGQ